MQPGDLNSSKDLFNKTSFTTEIRCSLTHSHLCWWVDDFKSLSGNEQVNIGGGLLLAFRHLSEKQNIRMKWKELHDFSKDEFLEGTQFSLALVEGSFVFAFCGKTTRCHVIFIFHSVVFLVDAWSRACMAYIWSMKVRELWHGNFPPFIPFNLVKNCNVCGIPFPFTKA